MLLKTLSKSGCFLLCFQVLAGKEASAHRCSAEKVFLKISQYPLETPGLESAYNAVAGLSI